MFVAWRDLRFARGRFALITAVVALMCVLVGFLSGLTGGLAWQNISALTQVKADHLLIDTGSATTPGFAESSLTPAQADAVIAERGEASVSPLGISQLRATAGTRGAGVAVLADDGRVLPDAPADAGGVVLSRDTADALEVSVGDEVTLAAVGFTVERIVPTTWYSHAEVARVQIADWRALEAATGTPDAVATALAVRGDAVTDVPGLEAQTPLGALGWLPAFRSEIGSLGLMVTLLFGISALVVGAFFVVWTLQRTGDIAVLKALGASDRALRLDALGQALVVLLAGILIGFGFVLAAGMGLQGALPFMISPLTTLVPAAAMLLLGLLGAAVSLRGVTSADPLTALGSNR